MNSRFIDQENPASDIIEMGKHMKEVIVVLPPFVAHLMYGSIPARLLSLPIPHVLENDSQAQAINAHSCGHSCKLEV